MFTFSLHQFAKKGSCANTDVESGQPTWKKNTSMFAASARFSTMVVGLRASGVALPWGAVFNRLCCSTTDDHYGTPHFTCHWKLAQCTCLSPLSNIKWILLLFLFQNSISTPVTVVDVPPILNKTIKSGHHLCFFGVKLRINWFDKLLIITSQPTRG